MWDLIKDVVPTDHADQVSSVYYVEKLLKNRAHGTTVLDLGCGVGRSRKTFFKFDPAVRWHGLDIESSPEVDDRTRWQGEPKPDAKKGADFYTFDGVHIPFPDDTFDIVYSHQVFEHVRHPDALLAEVRRVLKEGGAFIGSVSSLEPYHSFSYWNYTPFGWYRLLLDAGLTPIEFRPGIDGVALAKRLYFGKNPESDSWWRESPLNRKIAKWGKRTKRPASLINVRKLQYCGHLVFQAEKRGHS